MEKLDPKAVWLFFFRFLEVGLVILIIAILIMGTPIFVEMSIKGGLRSKIIPILLLASLFFVIFCYLWAKLSYDAYKYELTEEAFKKEHGVIWKRYISIPYERIQNIDIHRGVLARILGLSDLMIQTAAYSGSGRYGLIGVRDPEGKLPGLSKEKAEELRSELIRRTKGTKSGM